MVSKSIELPVCGVVVSVAWVVSVNSREESKKKLTHLMKRALIPLDIDTEIRVLDPAASETGDELFDVLIVDKASEILIKIVEKVSGSVCCESLGSKDANALAEFIDI